MLRSIGCDVGTATVLTKEFEGNIEADDLRNAVGSWDASGHVKGDVFTAPASSCWWDASGGMCISFVMPF